MKKNLLTIEDILNPEGTRFLSRDELNDKYDVKINVMLFNQIISAIPKSWLSKINTDSNTEPCRLSVDNIRNKKATRVVYTFITQKNLQVNPIQNYAEKWAQDLGIACDPEQYKMFFIHRLKISDSTKLRDFQYRLLLRKIFTNVILFKWKIKNTAICELCNLETQTIVHLLCKCPTAVKCLEFIRRESNNVPYLSGKTQISSSILYIQIPNTL